MRLSVNPVLLSGNVTSNDFLANKTTSCSISYLFRNIPVRSPEGKDWISFAESYKTKPILAMFRKT